MKLIEIIPAYFYRTRHHRTLPSAGGRVGETRCRLPGHAGVYRQPHGPPYYLEGFRLLEEHVARAPQIDRPSRPAGTFA